MSFLESPRFPACPSFGFTSQPMYSVSSVVLSGGQRRPNRNWNRPLYQYNASVSPRAEDDVQELLEFWHAVGGTFTGFRFRDHADYKSCRVNQTPTATDQPVVGDGGSPATYRLTKRYTVGSMSQDREVYKPIDGEMLLAADGSPLSEGSDFTIDYANGIVTYDSDVLNTSPAPELTWGGLFDVPVYFDSGFPVELLDKQIEGVNFALMELRPPKGGW